MPAQVFQMSIQISHDMACIQICPPKTKQKSGVIVTPSLKKTFIFWEDPFLNGLLRVQLLGTIRRLFKLMASVCTV